GVPGRVRERPGDRRGRARPRGRARGGGAAGGGRRRSGADHGAARIPGRRPRRPDRGGDRRGGVPRARGDDRDRRQRPEPGVPAHHRRGRRRAGAARGSGPPRGGGLRLQPSPRADADPAGPRRQAPDGAGRCRAGALRERARRAGRLRGEPRRHDAGGGGRGMTRRQFALGGGGLVAGWLVATARGVSADPAPASADAPAPGLIEDLVAANRILADQGVLDGYGHVSARHDRDPDRYLLSRSLAPELVTAGDVMEYDLDSRPVDPRGRTAYLERFIHGEVYRARPDVKAIVHHHAPSVIPFGASTVPLRPLYHMAAFLGGGVPVFDIRAAAGGPTDMLVSSAALGRALGRTLGEHPAVL